MRNVSTRPLGRAAVHAILAGYTIIALFPIVLILINSVKTRAAIFDNPLALPTPSTFSLVGFHKVLANSDFLLYFGNSLFVTLLSLLLIVLFGAMAAWALSEYTFTGNRLLTLYLALGIMIPIRLGTVSILELVVRLDLINTLSALVLVYTAQGLPLAVMILSEFVRQVPRELKDAARCDGVGEFAIFFQVILPLIRPAIATVAVFTMIPAWNDLWFPLILAPSDRTKTVTLGVQQFIGQYVTDWNSVLAALSLAVIPVLVMYVIFSRQLIRGLTSGAVK
ncbi:carbohydrate ABC transporter permease [Janthinobacterium lividum]|jgi:raffinose/stachyose/melibiose transport system permease protein|uniref:Carbohydrate ABC transporter permease n=1 Tax=Janthinobacterium lividum TaxID=29581 RepID=A0AAJ4MXR4_9BURK|nr:MULTISPECIES: carbohydrate ABC transporter permease [Janthinobacterium]KAB0324593.1 carbohydrate ABC transporter permease [Janthinobacterium lividum]KHA80619.1 sugar ABC transporter permease [Janthinobacterium lividum]MBR7632455.1 carbohydrate ABC transporter permease [Janthinobacterium lividum]MCC7712741.1 carbohydrate ABC transporter permease [Janthinobacterium lividum]MDQ4629168.1 carbohydrate ABC transporter permease [Janthinobacterium lividum]